MPNETRAPNITRVRTSRPTWSVPNQWSADGGSNAASGCTTAPASAGYGASHGANSPSSTTIPANTRPTSSKGKRRARRHPGHHPSLPRTTLEIGWGLASASEMKGAHDRTLGSMIAWTMSTSRLRKT